MTTTERENVALAVHNILEENGFSEFKISLLRTNYLQPWDKLGHLFVSPFPNLRLNIQCCGSSQEGMSPLYHNFGLKADMDMLFILSNGKAYEERTVYPSPATDEYQYLIMNCENYSGYVNLQLGKEGTTILNFCAVLDTRFGSYVTGDGGQKYLSNVIKDKIAKYGRSAVIMNVIKKQFIIALIGTHDQGPSVEHKVNGITMGYHNGFECEKFDVVYAIPCSHWPSVAKEWLTRERKYGWPTGDLITKMERSGACLVPMGLKGSPTESIEWKYSFSHSEKYLIWSLNVVQFKCYAVLKLLKYYVLAPVLGDIISSYIIKTSLLWTVEGTPSNIWQPPMLLDCTKRCLIRMKDWVIKDFCPNYIMRECNLLKNRYTVNEKDLVLDTLRDLIENLEDRMCHIPPIMKELQKKSVQQLARKNSISMRKMKSLSTNPKVLGESTVQKNILDCLILDILVPLYYGTCKQNDNLLKTASLLYEALLNAASDVDFDNNHYHNLYVLLTAKSVVLLVMHQLSCGRNRHIYKLISKMKRLCQPVGKTKILANMLYLATIYLGMNESQRVIKITNEVHQYFQSHLYIKEDYYKVFWQPNIDEADYQDIKNHDLQALNTNILVNDVHFAFVEFPYLPQPIQFDLVCREKTESETGESNRFPIEFITAIDPLVYTSFLQFWCHHPLQNNVEQLTAIGCLRERCEHHMTTHKNIAWNLLGYCYQAMGRHQDAFSAFYCALKHNPKSHASLLYMAILLNDLIRVE